jgi:hypothetical protein
LQTCVKNRSEADAAKWFAGEYIAHTVLTLSDGDHVLCNIPQGCEKLTMDVYYEGSNSPVVFVNGRGLREFIYIYNHVVFLTSLALALALADPEMRLCSALFSFSIATPTSASSSAIELLRA